jgi:hypothetical protein
MNSAITRRYSPQQVLRGLKQIWKDEFGCRFPPDPNTKIPGSSWVIDELDFADIIRIIERFFGFQARRPEWLALINRPDFTFQALAEFIVERAEAICFEPLDILGRPCKTAGIFRGIEEAARQALPTIARFGCSTPIRERFRGFSLIHFWNRIRWLSDEKVPLLGNKEFIAASNCAFVCIVIGLILSLLISSSLRSMLLVGGCVAAAAIYLVGFLFMLYWKNPLPPGIHTFGDLARAWPRGLEADGIPKDIRGKNV